MRTLIIENQHEIDIPEELQRLMGVAFKEGRELWCHFHEAFWPENRKETLGRLMQLKTNDVIVCQHVFDGYQQLELMSEVLNKLTELGEKIDVYIVHPTLDEELNDFLDKYESSITPDTEEYDDDPDLRQAFKKSQNDKVISAVKNHRIFGVCRGWVFKISYSKSKKKFSKRKLHNIIRRYTIKTMIKGKG